LIGALAQVLLLGGDQLNSTMHIRETRIIGLLFFGEQRGDAGKEEVFRPGLLPTRSAFLLRR
jgi:hypothetical protein